MSEQSTLVKLLMPESAIAETILELENSKNQLGNIIDSEIQKVLERKFRKPYDEIAAEYKDKIMSLKDSLYKEYLAEINNKIQQVYTLKEELSST